MLKNPFRRKVIATAAAAAVAAGGLVGLAASPASAAVSGLSCDTPEAALLAIAGITPPVLLDATATNVAPATIDVVGGVTGTVNTHSTVSMSVPDSLLGLGVAFGLSSFDVHDAIATVKVDNGGTTAATLVSPPAAATVVIASPAPVAIDWSDSFTAAGAEDDELSYLLTGVDFTLTVMAAVPPNPPAPLDLHFFCTPTPDGALAGTTTLLQPGPPTADDTTVDVALGGVRDIAIPALGYPAINSLTFTGAELDGSFIAAHGTFSAPVDVGGVWHTTYTHDVASGDTGTTPDAVTYTASNVDGNPATPDGTDTGVISVNVLGNECSTTATGECSLKQIIDVDVVGAELSMSQAGGTVHLVDDTTFGPVVLNGEYQLAVGALNQITVLNARGDGARWDLTGQVSDFTIADEYTGTGCPSTDPTSWDYQCVPGSNLVWFPDAAVHHLQIPGDVAAVTPGATQDPLTAPAHGMGTEPQALCFSEATHSGGTFTCDADLVLAIPASAGAGNYTATLTLTLA